MVSTLAGMTVFLAFMLFSVQLLTNLYATSVVTSVAQDGVRQVAISGFEAPGTADLGRAMARQEVRMRDLLGGHERRVEFDWNLTPDQVELTVSTDNPSFLLRSLGGTLPFSDVERTVSARVEQVR